MQDKPAQGHKTDGKTMSTIAAVKTKQEHQILFVRLTAAGTATQNCKTAPLSSIASHLTKHLGIIVVSLFQRHHAIDEMQTEAGGCFSCRNCWGACDAAGTFDLQHTALAC